MIPALISSLLLGLQVFAVGIGTGEVWRALGRLWWLPGGGLALYLAVSIGWPPQSVRALQGTAQTPYLLSDALRGGLLVLATIAALVLLRRAVGYWRDRAERAERALAEYQKGRV